MRVGGFHALPATPLALLDREQILIEGNDRPADHAPTGSAPVGMEADHRARGITAGRAVRRHPIIVAVLGAVDHVGKDLFFALQMVPPDLVTRLRHCRMPKEDRKSTSLNSSHICAHTIPVT